MRLTKTILLYFYFASLAYSQSNFKFIQLQKSETLSDLVSREGLTPLYGKEGWVKRVMHLNRVNNLSSKKLDPGAVIILPNFVLDTVSKKQSSTLSTGFLNRASSKTYQVELSTDWSIQEQNYADELSFKYGVGIKVDRHKKTPLAFGINFSHQKSILISQDENSYARFNPDYNIWVSRPLNLESFSFAPLLNFKETSTLWRTDDYQSVIIRRDRNLEVGLFVEYHKLKNINFSTKLSLPFYSKNLNGYDSKSYFESYFKLDANIINDFKIGLFSRINSSKDQNDYQFGLVISKIFNKKRLSL